MNNESVFTECPVCSDCFITKSARGIRGYDHEKHGDKPWYHGTSKEFTRFSFGHRGSNTGDWNTHLGVHFTSDPAVANEMVIGKETGHIHHVQLGLKNPKIYKSEFDMDDEVVRNKPYLDTDKSRYFRHQDMNGRSNISEHKEWANNLRRSLIDQGHDGIVYGNEMEKPGHASAIAFFPNQIRHTHIENRAGEVLKQYKPRRTASLNLDGQDNYRKFGTYHPACGRVLKNRHIAALEDDAMDNVPKGIEPVRHVIQGAQAYARAKGLDDPHDGIDYSRVTTHRDLLKNLAKHYDSLPLDDPRAHKHFDAMRQEVDAQHHFMTTRMGIKTQVVDHDPYKDVHELRNDVENNRQIKVLGTHATGSHPYFSNDENDRFRAVHDVFGHLGTGRAFDRHGEEAAFQAHSRMFSHHALPAMTSETRGQNASLIVNGHFGPQRIAVLPQHLWHPGLAHTSGMVDEYRWDQDAQNRRAEYQTGGYGRETDSYYGRDGEGDARETRINFKDYLKQHKGPEEGDYENQSWSEGNAMGIKHSLEGHHPRHSDEFRHGVDNTYSDEHFIKGYLNGQENVVSQRVAVLVGSSDDDAPIGLKVLAHVSGNSVNILHCPFCGSGAVIGRSDGTVECGYCTSVFTVQVQPSFNGFPQSVDGQQYPWPGQPAPGDVLSPTAPPGTNLAPGVQPAGDPMDPNAMGGPTPGGPPESSDPADGDDPFASDDDSNDNDDSGNPFAKGKSDKKGDSKDDKKKSDKDKKSGNPFAKKKSFLTTTGATLSEDDYLEHLFIRTAVNRTRAIETVKAARAQ